jgi:ABC-type branched-subunit amino acid transport system substrate-binding protein
VGYDLGASSGEETSGSGRWRRLVPLAVLAVLALSCSNHDPAAVDAARNGDPVPATTAAGGTGGGRPGVFGTLPEAVCGPGSASASSAQGVSSSIKVGVLGDADNTLIPDVNKELYDASNAFVSWCNKAGGINGRKIELTERDAGLLKAREVMTEACAQDFAVVGGGLALDFQAVDTRTGCGLPDFAGFANSVDARESDLQVQAIPAYKTQWPSTQYVQIAKAFPQSIKGFGLMVTSAQLGSGRPYDQRVMDALRPMGYSLAYKGDLPAPPVPVDNWRPYIEEMKAKGVKVLDFEVTPEYLVPLLRTMRDVNWYPDAIVLQPNFYSPALLEAGDALRNTYVGLYAFPFEQADRNPPTKQFLSIMDAGSPGWRRGGLAVNSFSAWLLFAKAAATCGDALTRKCVYDAARKETAWSGGGLASPVDLSQTDAPLTCFNVEKATASGWQPADFKPDKGAYRCGAPAYKFVGNYGKPITLSDVGKSMSDFK